MTWKTVATRAWDLPRTRPRIDGDLTEARIVGRVLLTAAPFTKIDDRIVGNAGMGGQGVLEVPVVYNDWVQKQPERFKRELTPEKPVS
jgi:hypothetical protein